MRVPNTPLVVQFFVAARGRQVLECKVLHKTNHSFIMDVYGEIPNLIPLFKVQELIFMGGLSALQFDKLVKKTGGKIAVLGNQCQASFVQFARERNSNVLFANVFQAAACACPEQTTAYANCIQSRTQYFEELEYRKQNGHPPPECGAPSCERLKQQLEMCAQDFSAKVIKTSLDSW